MIVDVQASIKGVPYSFKGVQVASIEDLRQRYQANGIEIVGYTIVNPSGGNPIVNTPTNPVPPAVVQQGTAKGVLLIGGLLVLWMLFRS